MKNNYRYNIFRKYKYNFNYKLIISTIILCISDILNNNKIIFLKKTLNNNINYFIYNPIIYIKYFFYRIKNNFLINEKLLEKNDNLNKNIILNKIIMIENKKYLKENLILKKSLNIYIKNKNKYVFSKIIYYNHLFSRLIINKGIEENINIGDSVLDHNGNIIGYISLSNNKNSYVNLIYSNKCKISVKIIRNKINFIAKGYGINNLLVCKNFNILTNNSDDIKEGDILVSSGLDNVYPKEYKIGYIKKIIKNSNNYYLDIEIKTLFNINNTYYVIILKKNA